VTAPFLIKNLLASVSKHPRFLLDLRPSGVFTEESGFPGEILVTGNYVEVFAQIL
jgi:hypothetical protein